MNRTEARQIADLLNSQNQLTVNYTADMVIANGDNYLLRQDDSGQVLACAELKKVQWYQFELLHLTVAEDHHRHGHARALLASAEKQAIQNGARILQSTIRDGNTASEALFKSSGFQSVSCFYNASSKNMIRIWQKVLTAPPSNYAIKGTSV